MTIPRDPLPIDDVLPRLLAVLEDSSCVVLKAPTGAGKTTRVPPALRDTAWRGDRKIVILEPRRVAARAAARRMCVECGATLGEEIGYQVRFDKKWNQRTRILVVTEGTLIRMMQEDPFLEGVAAVLFDEFHERSLDTDVSLGMVRRIQQTVRSDLRIVVMSATLGTESVSRFLGDCPVVVSEGRLFPVSISHEPRADRVPLGTAVAEAVASVMPREATGDVLVFLPGQREIRDAARALEPFASDHGVLVMPLHGDLPAEQQDAALQKQDRRKVVLATNVAETSVTVDGVTAVIDSGLSRQLRFDSAVGLDRLELLPISKASAEQRAGRAGRQRSGVCVRLWSEASHRARPEQTDAEIQRVDLAGPVLQLKAWGERDVLAFPWFERPKPESVAHAEALLQRLGAIAANGEVTSLGSQLATLPVHPRLGRLLIEGARRGCSERAALAAALLSERDPFESFGSAVHRSRRGAASASDVLDRVEALEEFTRTGNERTSQGTLVRGAAQFILQVKEQLSRLVRRVDVTARRETLASGRDHDEALLKSLLAAFPDRLAKRRETNSPRGILVGGRGVRLAPQSRVTESELFLCLDVEGSGSEVTVRMASSVERGWLPSELLSVQTQLEFDDASGRVQARRRVCWDDLLLEETPAALPQDDSVTELLVEAATRRWEEVCPNETTSVGRFLIRVQCLREWCPEAELPEFDAETLQVLLPALCVGRRSLNELRDAPWLEELQARLTPAQWQAVERDAPTHVTVPSGSRIALEYQLGRPPVLAVRIQELFGLRETPRIARGRVPVLLHLLAPNYRPQQVTDDLPSFWKNAYPIVRGELRRRYPRHPWPDDPLTATAIRK